MKLSRLVPMLMVAATAATAATAAVALPQARRAAPHRAPAVATKPAATNWLNVVVRTPEGGYRQGNPNAPAKLVEYGSRTCPTCGRFANEAMEPLRREFIATGKVSYEYRDLLIHGAPDMVLALVNQCVPTARFFPVLDAIYANQPQFEAKIEALVKDQKRLTALQAKPTPQLIAGFADAMGAVPFAQRLGLAPAQTRKCLGDPALIKRIARANAAAVNQQHVQSTPSFFLNGRALRAFTWDALQPELRAVLN